MPAIPEKVVIRTVTVCDDCGKEIAAYICRCEECGAELCHKCAKTHPEDVGGDCTDHICGSCLEVFGTYLPQIEEAEDRLDALKDARNEDCCKKRKNKNEINKT